MLARFQIGFFNQGFRRQKASNWNVAFAREKTHLIDQPRDAFDAIGERLVEGFAEFPVLVFFREQLLVGGQRHQCVADFVREPVGHVFDEAQVGGLDFQAAQLLDLGEIIGGQQRGHGHGGISALKRHHADVVNRARQIFRLVTYGPMAAPVFKTW